MKKTLLAALLVFISLSLTGCGNDHNNNAPLPITTQFLSDPAFDGDIQFTPPSTFLPAQGNTQSVFAGIVPATVPEYRAFLDFPLSTVPLNAGIVSATLIIYFDSIQSTTSTIPMDIELVSFSSLSGPDFNSAPLLGTAPITFSVFQTDVNHFLAIDVTSLMVQAQNLSLPDFQIRMSLDLSAVSGRIEIDDTTGPNRTALAPLLQVEYF
jgi:hypothetical protein